MYRRETTSTQRRAATRIIGPVDIDQLCSGTVCYTGGARGVEGEFGRWIDFEAGSWKLFASTMCVTILTCAGAVIAVAACVHVQAGHSE